MSKPYILLVTGSFAHASLYDDLVARVKAHGYDMKALQLLSAGTAAGEGRDTPGTMYDDAAFIAKEVETLADAGREVVLVAHSYGGMPATESTKGLSVQERQKQGKKGGLRRLAYMTVLLTKPGHSASEVLPGPREGETPSSLPDEKGWLHFTNPEDNAFKCFSDLSKEEALYWHKQFSLHSAVSFINPLTHPGYKDVPVSYLLCEDDQIIFSEIQRREIEMIEEESGNKVDVTSIKAGHCPNASVPEDVVSWIISAADKA